MPSKSTYLSRFSSPREVEPKEGHLPLFKRALEAYVDGANLLSRGFIGFPCKPSYSASFSPLIFLLHYLNKSLLTDSVHLSNYLDPPGLDPSSSPCVSLVSVSPLLVRTPDILD